MKLHVTVLVLIVFAMALTGCIDHDNRPLTKEQLNEIAENIRPFHVVDTGEVFVVDTNDILPGAAKYAACGACHGSNGMGGVGPMLRGRDVEYLTAKLNAYRAGETVGSQSNLMWANAGGLSDQDIQELSEYIVSL